jgi:hypothetical protein
MRQHLTLAAATALMAALVAAAQAAPYTPANDDEIVQRLPIRWDAVARQRQMALAREPRNLALGLATARAAIERARRHGDPRELGVAQAALAPWWTMDAPPHPVRLLRAIVRQSAHEFDAALADLERLVHDRTTPLAIQAQAGLTHAAVLQVTGRLAEAAQACRALRSAHFESLGRSLSIPARACSAELRSLAGHPQEAATELEALAREAPDDRWLSLVRAELAQRMGDDAAAQARFGEATGADADVYALTAHADWLLDRGRHAEALALAQSGDLDADALMLRQTIALHRLRDPRAAAAASAMKLRFEAARQRGGNLHAREEARLALDVLDEPAHALALARENWTRQKEPADAVLLWRAAQAAGQPAAADLLRAWVKQGASVDVRLAGLDTGGRT